MRRLWSCLQMIMVWLLPMKLINKTEYTISDHDLEYREASLPFVGVEIVGRDTLDVVDTAATAAAILASNVGSG